MGTAGYPAAGGVEPDGSRRDEFRVGGGVLRCTDRGPGSLRERDSVAAIPVQPGAGNAQGRRRPGEGRPQLFETDADVRNERSASIAGGKLTGRSEEHTS